MQQPCARDSAGSDADEERMIADVRAAWALWRRLGWRYGKITIPVHDGRLQRVKNEPVVILDPPS